MFEIADGKKHRKPTNTDVKKETKTIVSPEMASLQMQTQLLESYIAVLKQQIRDPNKPSKAITFSKVSKAAILQYLETPESNEKNIRNASIYMWGASSHYRRLLLYYGTMLLYAYIIVPANFDLEKAKANPDAFIKSFQKAKEYTELLSIPHEFTKAALVALKEGVFYGIASSNKTSFFLTGINADYCKITGIEDGRWLFSIDCSQIKLENLIQYPPEVTTMWNESKRTGAKYVEVPSDVCFCLKADETSSTYNMPMFASVLPEIFDIDHYKELQSVAEDIANYKLLSMQIPLSDNGTPQLSWELALQYYNQLMSVLPPYVTATVTPMEITPFDFPKSAAATETDEVARAEEQYWAASGTSSLLFGSAKNTSASALRLSMQSDESIMLTFLDQVQRLINTHMKKLSGTMKFKVLFLPVTRYNLEENIKRVKDGGTYGLPVKTAYSALLSISPVDIQGLDYLEMIAMNLGNLTPFANSHTQSANAESGRPSNVANGDPLTDAGEQTLDSDANANKKAGGVA